MKPYHHRVTLPARMSLTVSIIHYSRQVFKASSCIGTELWYIGSCWSSCLCSSIWRGPQEYVTYEFVPTSPAVSCMSSSSNLDSFRSGCYLKPYHHHVTLPARISLTLSIVHCSRQVFKASSCIGTELWYIGSSCHPAFACSCEGVHRSMSLMSLSLLLLQCHACLVCLTWIVFVMGGRWLYSCCFVGCCLQDLFNITRSILVIAIKLFLHMFS